MVMAEENMEKREFDEKLILEVEANPALYNKTERSYSDRYKKEEGWQHISIVLNADVKLCKERWKNLRDTFAKYYKKEKYTPSGSQAPIKIGWPYYEIMKFLIPNVEVPRTFGNMEREKIASETVPTVVETVPTEEEITTASNKRPNSSPNAAQKPPKKNKKKSESDSDKFLAALSGMSEPETQPLEKFFLSLAQRASSWSRKKTVRFGNVDATSFPSNRISG